MLFRQALLPYVYSAARASYDTGVAVVHPLYYDFPTVDEAYEYREQYMFGEALLVAPITDPADDDNMTTHSLWLPSGLWTHVRANQRMCRRAVVILRRSSISRVCWCVRSGRRVERTSDRLR